MENIKKLEETMNRNKESRNEQLQELDLEGGEIKFGISFNLKNADDTEE